MSPKLLYVINDARFFLSHRLALAKAAKEKGYDVHVAAPASPSLDRVASEGFPVHAIPLQRSGKNPLAELRTIGALFLLYRRLRPDLIHHLTIKPMLYGSIAAGLSGSGPVVNAVTGMGYVFTNDGITMLPLRWAVQAAYQAAFGMVRHRIIFQNPDDRNFFLENRLVEAGEAVLIRGSGVDPDAFPYLPEPDGTPLVVLASRMLWHKGIGEFVEAAKSLKADGVDARFALVGESDPGNPASVSDDRLRAWASEGAVEWWGRRDDMPSVFAQTAVVCLPSIYREGVPKVLIEAASAGRPIVTTDMPGCREIVVDGESGTLVPPGDTEALALALKALILQPETRKRMGRKGRQLVESEFSLEKVIDATLKTYDDLRTETARLS